MTLSIDEIELGLEEHPHDLSAWGEWLSYNRRHALSHNRYIDYLKKEGFLIEDHQKNIWNIERGNNLEFLRGVVTNEPTILRISGSELKSTQGIEDFIAPNLGRLDLIDVDGLEITKGFPTLTISNSKINISDNIDLSGLTFLALNGVKIYNISKIYDATNLDCLTVKKVSPSLQISNFKNLRIIRGSYNLVKKFGDSDTVQYIYANHSLSRLMDRGWYPNLEYPFKGKNKR